MQLELMSESVLEALFEFERENRDFFETSLPPRPETYHQLDTFRDAMICILAEQDRGDCYMYIMRDDQDKLIGRINLVKMEDETASKYELGYRLAQAEQGKGYATEAVKLVIAEAREKWDIQYIEAGTSTENIGSQKVLMKNGFEKVEEVPHVMAVNGRWLDGILFGLVIG